MNRFEWTTAALAAIAIACLGAVLYGLAVRPAAAEEKPAEERRDVIRYCPRGPMFPCQDYITTCTTKGDVTTCKTTVVVGGGSA